MLAAGFAAVLATGATALADLTAGWDGLITGLTGMVLALGDLAALAEAAIGLAGTVAGFAGLPAAFAGAVVGLADLAAGWDGAWAGMNVGLFGFTPALLVTVRATVAFLAVVVALAGFAGGLVEPTGGLAGMAGGLFGLTGTLAGVAAGLVTALARAAALAGPVVDLAEAGIDGGGQAVAGG